MTPSLAPSAPHLMHTQHVMGELEVLHVESSREPLTSHTSIRSVRTQVAPGVAVTLSAPAYWQLKFKVPILGRANVTSDTGRAPFTQTAGPSLRRGEQE